MTNLNKAVAPMPKFAPRHAVSTSDVESAATIEDDEATVSDVNDQSQSMMTELRQHDALPIDQLANFAASGTIQDIMTYQIYLALVIGGAMIIATVCRRVLDSNVIAPYMRHNEEQDK